MNIYITTILFLLSLNSKAITITNESIKEHFSKHSENKVQKPQMDQDKKQSACSKSYVIVEKIKNKKYEELADYISWPLRRKFPLPDLSRKKYLENSKIVFDEGFNSNKVTIKKVKDTCMLSNGIAWIRTDEFGGKLFTLNYLSIHAKIEISKLEHNMKSYLPSKYKNSNSVLKCAIGKIEYRIFHQRKMKRYLLQVIKKGRVTDFIVNGERLLTNGSPLYKFIEGKTTLTISRQLDGYVLSLKNPKRVKSYTCK
jgi:hypothetical protein